MIGVASFSYGPTAVLFNNKNIIVASPVALKKRRKVYILNFCYYQSTATITVLKGQ